MVHRTALPALLGWFNPPGSFSHCYPSDVSIMEKFQNQNCFLKNWWELIDEDALWAGAMQASMRLAVRPYKKVDDYPLLNRLMWIGLDDSSYPDKIVWTPRLGARYSAVLIDILSWKVDRVYKKHLDATKRVDDNVARLEKRN